MDFGSRIATVASLIGFHSRIVQQVREDAPQIVSPTYRGVYTHSARGRQLKPISFAQQPSCITRAEHPDSQGSKGLFEAARKSTRRYRATAEGLLGVVPVGAIGKQALANTRART